MRDNTFRGIIIKMSILIRNLFFHNGVCIYGSRFVKWGIDDESCSDACSFMTLAFNTKSIAAYIRNPLIDYGDDRNLPHYIYNLASNKCIFDKHTDRTLPPLPEKTTTLFVFVSHDFYLRLSAPPKLEHIDIDTFRLSDPWFPDENNYLRKGSECKCKSKFPDTVTFGSVMYGLAGGNLVHPVNVKDQAILVTLDVYRKLPDLSGDYNNLIVCDTDDPRLWIS
jgi:hypothetical protein